MTHHNDYFWLSYWSYMPDFALGTLRQLGINCLGAKTFTETIATVQKRCPSLEVWLGDNSVQVDVKRLAEGFNLFKSLRIIYLGQCVIGDGKAESYVLELAKSCMKLEKNVAQIKKQCYSLVGMNLSRGLYRRAVHR
jgi:hypothetical protein